MIGIKVTDAQHKVYQSWPGTAEEHAEYMRQCIDTRFSGDVDEMRRRRDMLRSKAAELNTEAQELEQVIIAEEEREDTISFEKARDKYLDMRIYEREHEQQLGWLNALYKWSRVRANEFLAWVNADRTGEEND